MLDNLKVPRSYLKQATTASVAAVGLGVLATVALPLAPVTTLVATLAALVVADRSMRASQRRFREARELVSPRWFRLDPSEIPYLPGKIYIGEGYLWTHEHRQIYDDTIAIKPVLDVKEYRHELESLGRWPRNLRPGEDEFVEALKLAKSEGGDPRILGMGQAGMHSVFVDEDLMSQHLGVWGATGTGKTRCIESFISSILHEGHGLILIDPKSDVAMTGLCWSLCERYKRNWSWVSLSNPAESDKYNPLACYDDPAELFTRVAALIPDSPDNPFWSQTPAKAAGSALVVKGWARRLAEVLGSQDDLPAPIHVALAHASSLAEGRGAAEPSVADIEAGWAYATSNEIQPVADGDVGGAYMMTERGLVPALSTLYRDAVEQPRATVAMAVKIFHPELWVGQDPSRIQRIEEEMTAAAKRNDPKAEPVKIRLEDQIAAKIPLEEGYEGPEWLKALWKPLAEKRIQIANALKNIRDTALRDMIPWGDRPDEERGRFCSSLGTALGGFVGRFDLFCSAESKLDLRRVVERGEVGYIALNHLSFKESAKALAKLLIADLAALAGRVNASGVAKPRRVYVMIDECALFCTPELSTILRTARSAGVSVTLMGQTRSALEDGLGGKANVDDALGNLFVTAQLRAGNDAEAEACAKLLSSATIARTSYNVGLNPALGSAGHGDVSIMSSNQGQTTSKHDTTLVPAQMMTELPKGVAVWNINRMCFVVQCPQIIVNGGKTWHDQLKEPLPPWYLEVLAENRQAPPAWHNRLVAAAEANAREAA